MSAFFVAATHMPPVKLFDDAAGRNGLADHHGQILRGETGRSMKAEELPLAEEERSSKVVRPTITSDSLEASHTYILRGILLL